MNHRRESSYHQDLTDFLEGEQWSQQDIEELEAHAHAGISVSDERLEDLTRFIVLKTQEVAERTQEQNAQHFDQVFGGNHASDFVPDL